MPGARMNQPRKPETDLERSRRLREEATEASQRLGRVAHELLEQRAARLRKLAAEEFARRHPGALAGAATTSRRSADPAAAMDRCRPCLWRWAWWPWSWASSDRTL